MHPLVILSTPPWGTKTSLLGITAALPANSALTRHPSWPQSFSSKHPHRSIPCQQAFQRRWRPPFLLNTCFYWEILKFLVTPGQLSPKMTPLMNNLAATDQGSLYRPTGTYMSKNSPLSQTPTKAWPTNKFDFFSFSLKLLKLYCNKVNVIVNFSATIPCLAIWPWVSPLTTAVCLLIYNTWRALA